MEIKKQHTDFRAVFIFRNFFNRIIFEIIHRQIKNAIQYQKGEFLWVG